MKPSDRRSRAGRSSTTRHGGRATEAPDGRRPTAGRSASSAASSRRPHRARPSGSASSSSASPCRPATDERHRADLDELALLVDTAGADVVARVVQRRDRPDPATFIGKGKAEELRELSPRRSTADTVVFDDELSPAQQRNLEKLLGRTRSTAPR